jgi:hypothetical protein
MQLLPPMAEVTGNVLSNRFRCEHRSAMTKMEELKRDRDPALVLNCPIVRIAQSVDPSDVCVSIEPLCDRGAGNVEAEEAKPRTIFAANDRFDVDRFHVE